MSSGPSLIEHTRDPRRLLALSVVVALHTGIIYGFMQWGVRAEAPLKKAPAVQVALIAERIDEVQNLRPPPPKFITPVVEIAPPVINLQFSDPPTAITAHRTEATPTPPISAPPPKMVSTVEYLRPLKPRYPPTSRRLREEGMVVLLVLVNEAGKASRIEIRDSSGFQRLDRAAQEAVEWALFKPYVEDGIARPALVLIPVEFALSQRVAQR